ncbi:MAG: Fe-S cluster assembly protein SufD [Cyclobacteriaceae bacterium]
MGNKLQNIITEQFEAFEASLNGEKALPIHQLRRQSFDALQANGLPGNKDEEYKFTRLTAALERNIDLTLKNADPNISEDDIAASVYNLEGSSLFFVNGVYSEQFSTIHNEHQGILVQPITEALTEKATNPFTESGLHKKDPFLAWNTAFTKEGVHISIGKNKTYSKPIALYFITDANAAQVVANPKVSIDLGENSEATFLERFVTRGEHPTFNNFVLEINAGDGSRGKYLKIQDDKDTALHMNTSLVYQPNKSTFSVFTYSFSGKMVRNNLHTIIDGEGVEANMYGLYLTKGETHVDNHTVVDHRKPNSVSNELYKGIIDEQSRGVFNGKIFVRQLAQKTNAFQQNNNILLTDEATINTKPQLEIWADDVKCSHGCTTGQLDDESIFYLRTRGLNEKDAKVMLLQAFAGDIVEKTPLAEIRENLTEIIKERLS